jgi:hypothetical protein
VAGQKNDAKTKQEAKTKQKAIAIEDDDATFRQKKILPFRDNISDIRCRNVRLLSHGCAVTTLEAAARA